MKRTFILNGWLVLLVIISVFTCLLLAYFTSSFFYTVSLASLLQIEVCLPSKRRVDGKLQYYNLEDNVAIVSIKDARSCRAPEIDVTSQSEVGAQVVALGRGFKSGKLMATNGAVTGKRRKVGCKVLQISTCKITKVHC